MATQATTPAEVVKARDFETERAAIRSKLAATNPAPDEKGIRDLNQEMAQVNADETNSKRSGVGTRVRVGQTKGKSPMIITWEAFDDSIPESLPTSFKEFVAVTGVEEEYAKDKPCLVAFLIAGANELNYTTASDPLAEYVEPTWPADAQTNFRLVVRNYARSLTVPIDEAVALIKPGYVKQFGPK